MSKPLKISEEAAVQMPMKTVASLIAMVAIGTWAYFGIIETQNKLSTEVELMSKDLKLAVNAANQVNSNIEFGKKAEQIFTKMAEGVNGEKDFSAIIKEI